MGAGYDRTGDSGLGTRLAHRSGGGREGGDSAQRLRRRTGSRRPSRLRSVRDRIARTEAAACAPLLDGQAFVAVSRATWIWTAQATAECQVVGEFLRVVATRPNRIRGVGGAKYPNGSCDLPLTGVATAGAAIYSLHACLPPTQQNRMRQLHSAVNRCHRRLSRRAGPDEQLEPWSTRYSSIRGTPPSAEGSPERNHRSTSCRGASSRTIEALRKRALVLLSAAGREAESLLYRRRAGWRRRAVCAIWTQRSTEIIATI